MTVRCTTIMEPVLSPPAHLEHMQDLEFLEFFAGEGRTWRAMRADSIEAIGVDITYGQQEDAHQNAFDILTHAGMGVPSLQRAV